MKPPAGTHPGRGRRISRRRATVDYVWRNPVTNRVEKKRSYVRREGRSLIGVGHYLE